MSETSCQNSASLKWAGSEDSCAPHCAELAATGRGIVENDTPTTSSHPITARIDLLLCDRVIRSSMVPLPDCSRILRSPLAQSSTLFSMTALTSARPGRNQPCHCGSGRKYKHCCLEKDDAQAAAARTKAAAEAAARSSEAATSAPPRAPKPQTHQPWKATTSRGFVPRTRTPRKVGGS